MGESLRTGQHREQAQQQHLIERVDQLAALTRIRKTRKKWRTPVALLGAYGTDTWYTRSVFGARVFATLRNVEHAADSSSSSVPNH
jgi:hypothetical protein